MIIDSVYAICLYIANKEQRGNITPSQFNLLAKIAQLEFMSKRIGNIQIMNQQGVPQYGYESTWRIHEDLRPFIYGPITIPIRSDGNFDYPYGYIWPDAIHKNNFWPIKRITSDQYPFIKHSQITPPDTDYPVCVLRNPYGFIDPYSIASFGMSYVKTPPDPIWGYTVVSGAPVFDPSTSIDLMIPPMSYQEVALLILQHVGINLSALQVTEYANLKTKEGT
jgi:hypothetical protein